MLQPRHDLGRDLRFIGIRPFPAEPAAQHRLADLEQVESRT
jgi:hypothetical protein